MDFANLFSVILLLVAAGLTVLAGLPVLRKWQRDRDGGSNADAAGGRAMVAPAVDRADVAMEERGHLTNRDHPRSVDHHPHDDQDEQMRNRPADEQHHRPSHLGGPARPRQAEDPDPRHGRGVPVNGHGYGGFDDFDGDLPATDVNGGYEPAIEADEARRGAHFDWKVAAQYERARAARNASMSSFEPPQLPDDGPGTFTEEIPAIHAADGQRRHPAVHPDPDAPGRQLGQPHPGMPDDGGQGPFGDPWGSDPAMHVPPAFEFDEQRFDAYEEHSPGARPPYDQGGSPYGAYAAEPIDAEELAPPTHMRWQPDPEPDGATEEPAYGGQMAQPGARQAFAATTFRVQPAVEEPVSVHVAEPVLPTDPHGGYAPADPAGARYGAGGPVADPAAGYAGAVPDEGAHDRWVGEDTAVYPGVDEAHGYAGAYQAPAAPPTRYDVRHLDEPAGLPPVFDDRADAAPAEHATALDHAPPAEFAQRQRSPFPDLSPLLADDEVTELRQRWNEIKGTFPDDPVTSVKEASKLVGECTKLFERRLGVDPDSDDVSTEDLRLALQRYLAFFERLLSS